MKLHRLSLAAVVTAGSLMVWSSTGIAQDTNVNKRAEHRGPSMQQRVDLMATELKLNDDQKAKVTGLLEKQSKERRDIIGDTNLPREERRDKMRALMEEERKELKTILTPDQFAKMQQLREQRRPKRPGGAGQPGEPAATPAPAPAPAPAPSGQ